MFPIQKLNIQDSKAIDDTTIRTLAPTLIKQLPHSLLILDNAKYNQIHATNNMVAMKAKLHNQAYVHLKHKLGSLPSFCVVDQTPFKQLPITAISKRKKKSYVIFISKPKQKTNI